MGGSQYQIYVSLLLFFRAKEYEIKYLDAKDQLLALEKDYQVKQVHQDKLFWWGETRPEIGFSVPRNPITAQAH